MADDPVYVGYAKLNDDGSVASIYGAGIDYPDMPPIRSLFPMTQDDVTNLHNGAGKKHVIDGKLVLVPWPAPILSVIEQANQALTMGLAITSSVPNLAGTYAVDGTTQAHVQAEVLSLLSDGVFTDGTSFINWPSTDGLFHTFDPPTFRKFARALGFYLTSLFKVINGSVDILPAATIEVA